MQKIIIFKEVARDRIFDATSDEDLKKAFLATFKRRWENPKSNYHKHPYKPHMTEQELSLADLTDKEVQELPETLKKEILPKRNNILGRIRMYQKSEEEYNFWYRTAQEIMQLPYEEQLVYEVKLLAGNDHEYQRNGIHWLIDQRTNFYDEGYKVIELDSP